MVGGEDDKKKPIKYLSKPLVNFNSHEIAKHIECATIRYGHDIILMAMTLLNLLCLGFVELATVSVHMKSPYNYKLCETFNTHAHARARALTSTQNVRHREHNRIDVIRLIIYI